MRDRIVALVDDGLATGSSMQAAVLALRQHAPARIVVAVPVGAHETCERLRRIADRVVCVSMPDPFNSVGLWYEDFSQTTDEDVKQLLNSWHPTGFDQPAHFGETRAVEPLDQGATWEAGEVADTFRPVL